MKNSNKKTWDFWYDDEDNKHYSVYETLDNGILVLKLSESEILE